MDELKNMLLVNSLINIANCDVFPLEIRQDAARRVQGLLGLTQNKEFTEKQEQDLPSNIIR